MVAEYGAQSPEYNIPTTERKRETDWPRTLAFGLYFNACILLTHAVQFFVAILYPFAATRPYYEKGIEYTKLAFGRTVVAISQLFAPTTLVVTCSDENGAPLDPEKFIKRDSNGNVAFLNLPRKGVWMSNHQIYTDWLYLWCLAYYSDLADSMFITLMKLYKWLVPIGPAMQFFRFLFLTRKWDTDKAYLARKLSFLAHLASDSRQDEAARSSASKLLLLIFPEGTLVSPDTRPTSKKFADKSGIEDCTNLLLPRSTGIMFALRTLKADIKELKLVDFTIGYPGVPKPGDAQRYYTLRSTFMQGVAPPVVHVHFTVLSVDANSANAPPIGKLPDKGTDAALQESTAEENEIFGDWLRKRWRLKDDMLSQFYSKGDFMNGTYLERRAQGTEDARLGKQFDSVPYAEIPLKLRRFTEFADTVSWGIALPLTWLTYRFVRLFV